MFDELQLPEEVKKNLQDPLYLKSALERGEPLFQILGFTQNCMNDFYTSASSLYYKQDYSKASDAFYFLTTLNPNHPHYWLGLGLSEQQNGETHAALMAYSMATLHDPKNPIPYYQSAHCYLELNDRESALSSLELALSFSDSYPDIKARIFALKIRIG